jgi:hypothetical protein
LVRRTKGARSNVPDSARRPPKSRLKIPYPYVFIEKIESWHVICKFRPADFTERVFWFEPGIPLYLGAKDAA